MRPPDPPAAERPPYATGPLLVVALGVLALHAACLTSYGWFRDELYYLSCSHRLAWGYVDQPPFSIAVLALIRALAGESLVALRLVAALASAALALLTAALARELGGGRWAQVCAAFAIAVAPVVLAIGHFYSMNAFDYLFWALATLLALRAFERGGTGRWLALGATLGFGLLNKWSVGWLGAGLAAALLASPRRARLLTSGPWLAAALAGVIVAPHVLWEVRNHWPTLEFMRNAQFHKMRALEPLKFLLEQVLTLGPGAAPLWLAGLLAALVRTRWRPLAIVYLATLAILLAAGSARVEYLTLPAPALFAAGATWWEGRGRIARAALPALVLVFAAIAAPFGLPILPVRTFIAYQARLGRKPETEERHRMGALPQQYADMFGWPEFADSVARVAATLPPAERARAIVVVDNYGDAGALEHFGAGRIPTIACQHNSWYTWGPPAWDGGTAILVGRDSSEAAREFDHVIVAGVAGHPLAMSYEQDLPILIARGFRPDLRAAWAQGRKFE